ncbi:MAG: FAD-binding oxidoreductase [Lapillicoccus sp.]
MGTDTQVDVLDRLAAATGGHARVADDAEHVCGVPARWVVSPADTAETSAVLRATSTAGLTVVPRGAGTKLGWGAPPERVDVLLDTTRIDALVEHTAGDLVVVAGAGRRLTDLQEDCAGARQWLAIDPPRSGTVGGVVATASTGPTRLLHGPVRDLLIGATMVRADGVVARSGGKVVKNVAGYDIGKLLTGSFGTLAVITEVAFRLHPRPEARCWVTLPLTGTGTLGRTLHNLVHSHLVPTAVELDLPSSGQGSLAVLVEGIAPGVRSRAAQAAALLGPSAAASDAAPPWWGSEPGEPGGALLKITHEIAAVPQLCRAVAEAGDAAGLDVDLRGSVAVGAVLARVGPGSGEAVVRLVSRLRGAAPAFGGTVVVLDADQPTKAALDVWGPVRGLELMRALKQQFDPGRLLAPGRFVGGI